MRVVCNCVKETDPDFDLCAICVEGYKAGEVLRVLPCKYVAWRADIGSSVAVSLLVTTA